KGTVGAVATGAWTSTAGEAEAGARTAGPCRTCIVSGAGANAAGALEAVSCVAGGVGRGAEAACAVEKD
ncbi:hypothetical protein U1Q18_001220, partial [Sarracenia purpurea var. burkii]